jgi:Cdc6-like AAA superfamily ATPase
VASLVSSDHGNAEELNANVALLIGFALGLGKNILVLQQNPFPPILDLGTVLRPFETESEAAKIAESWLKDRNRELISIRSEKRQIVAKKTKANIIRGIYLGHPDALQDYNLMEYFVPTKEYDDAINARRSIFIGRRGSGKSANFQAITTELRENSNITLVTISPDDFEFERMGGFLEDEYALANPNFVYQTVWNYVFLTEIVRALGESTLRLYSSPTDLTRTRLFDFYQEERESLSLDFGSRLISKLRELTTITANLSTDNKRQQVEATVSRLRDYRVGQVLRDFAKDEKITYFIVIDDLDKHWRPESQESIGLLLGLIAEVEKLQRFFGDKLKIVLFLREDIYDILLQHDEELPKRNLLRIQWTIPNLKHVVAERIAVGAGIGNEDDDTTWSSLFCAYVGSEATHDYIISRTLPRPRDVLDFCQKAIDQAQRNGHDTITEQDVLDAEVGFSDSMFRSITLEYKIVYPKLDEVLLEFIEAYNIMHWTEFEKLGHVILTQHRNIIGKWYGAGNPDIHYLSSVLFRIGFIGFSKSEGQLRLFANGRSFPETWSLVRPTPQVEIHPAFYRVLEVKRRGISPPMTHRRCKAARDDRQLRLGLGTESEESE